MTRKQNIRMLKYIIHMSTTSCPRQALRARCATIRIGRFKEARDRRALRRKHHHSRMLILPSSTLVCRRREELAQDIKDNLCYIKKRPTSSHTDTSPLMAPFVSCRCSQVPLVKVSATSTTSFFFLSAMKHYFNIRKELYTNALLPGARPSSKEFCAHDDGIDGSFKVAAPPVTCSV